MKFRRHGFTLVELLVVIAVIGILIGMLMPAVQAVREAARRTDCANNIRQQATAMTSYESANQHLPPGFSMPGRAMWSCFILNHIEQGTLSDTINIEGPWFGSGANAEAIGKFNPIFKCPSANIDNVQVDPLYGTERAQSCYLACASGTNNRESGDLPWCGMGKADGYPESDGVFYLGSKTTTAQISDGLSNTVLLGESLPDQLLFQDDYSGNPQKVDHWYIGSDELGYYSDLGGSAECSECLASTACPINSIKFGDDTTANDKELSYGSSHAQGVNLAFADGHIKFVRESIDPAVFSAIGTRAGNEINTNIE